MDTPQLPPVPAALQALAGKQLASARKEPRTIPQWLVHLARLHRTMQVPMLERVKPMHALTRQPNEQNSDWQRRLADFDRACMALGEAYRAYLAAVPRVAEAIQTWQRQHGIAPGQRFTYEQDDDALVLHLQPVLALVHAEADGLAQQALDRWIRATTDYFRLLTPPPYARAA